jgi:hypothetical protein
LSRRNIKKKGNRREIEGNSIDKIIIRTEKILNLQDREEKST